METVYNDYHDKDVQFVYVYKALAHPEWNGYVTPVSLKERLMQIAEAKRTLGTKFTWLSDNMNNEFKGALGGAPNSEWIIDPKGVIVGRRDWSNAADLRKDLERIIGPVDHVTTIAELDMPTHEPYKAAASGVVPNIHKPRGMRPLSVAHVKTNDGDPFYAKLRAEAPSDVVKKGEGTMYLRFMMDPLYHVHWNNLVDPIHVEILAPEGVTVTPNVLDGPKVDTAEGDIDPREFLVKVAGAKEGDTFTLKARYYACTADWCLPVEQEYAVTLDMDHNGGFVIRMSDMRRRRGGGGGGGGKKN